jgi:tetratricopeptide (TPR) repeat protein
MKLTRLLSVVISTVWLTYTCGVVNGATVAELPGKACGDAAVGGCSKATGQELKNAKFFYNRGVQRSENGDEDKAIADFSEAIRMDPTLGDAYLQRGISWNKKGEYDKAISDLCEAIKLDPNCVVAYLNRGISWNNKGEFDKAIGF